MTQRIYIASSWKMHRVAIDLAKYLRAEGLVAVMLQGVDSPCFHFVINLIIPAFGPIAVIIREDVFQGQKPEPSIDSQNSIQLVRQLL